jgi:hypothetical protein
MSNEYQFYFPDDLTAEDHLLDAERYGGTEQDYYERLLVKYKDFPSQVKLLETLFAAEDRGYCELCRLRRGTGVVVFLEGKPEKAPRADDWIFYDSAAQISVVCAAKLGYNSPNQVSIAVPMDILNALGYQNKQCQQQTIDEKMSRVRCRR